MAKKKRYSQRSEEEEFVPVDIFYIPKAQVEMYQVLREAIALDVEAIWQEVYSTVGRLSDEDEGEAVVAYDETGHEQRRLYLNPTNISQGQVARDKGQLEKFLETHAV